MGFTLKVIPSLILTDELEGGLGLLGTGGFGQTVGVGVAVGAGVLVAAGPVGVGVGPNLQQTRPAEPVQSPKFPAIIVSPAPEQPSTQTPPAAEQVGPPGVGVGAQQTRGTTPNKGSQVLLTVPALHEPLNNTQLPSGQGSVGGGAG